MFQIHPWPSVILHLDGDAFFASVIQAVRPELKGRPLAVGRERGMATAVSYEAKRLGVRRGMLAGEIKKLCPQCFFIDSDYEIYALFSQKMFSILRSFFPAVEQYSIDEGFVDLKGLRRPLKMGYKEMGTKIKEMIESSLGVTVSLGISLTKSLAKLVSSSAKPSGLKVVNGLAIENFLKNIPLEKIWGVGENTSAYLQKLGLRTAFDFASRPEEFISQHLTKPYLEIWHELRGKQIYQLYPRTKQEYKRIAKSQTFSPSIGNFNILWAKLSVNIEEAFAKARRFNYQAGKIFIFLKTQQFNYQVRSIKLIEKTSYPFLIKDELKKVFAKVYKPGIMYRATGCYLDELEEAKTCQSSLFIDNKQRQKAKKIYSFWDRKKIDFGVALFDKQRQLEIKRPLKMSTPLLTIRSLN